MGRTWKDRMSVTVQYVLYWLNFASLHSLGPWFFSTSRPWTHLFYQGELRVSASQLMTCSAKFRHTQLDPHALRDFWVWFVGRCWIARSSCDTSAPTQAELAAARCYAATCNQQVAASIIHSLSCIRWWGPEDKPSVSGHWKTLSSCDASDFPETLPSLPM